MTPVVASLFSGCGGSSLGYKLAGFRVVYANEFVEAARETYKANFPATYIDPRDIREVSGKDILRLSKRKEIDILDGSPPCSSFSMAGSREAGWGKTKKYSDRVQRTDDLFFEYIRIIKELKPKVFVAENVKGLVTGSAKGYFLKILSGLSSTGYAVECRILNAARLGVPQSRQRVIFIGVRKDLKKPPVFPKPKLRLVSIRDALRGLPKEDTSALSIERFAIGPEWYRLRAGAKSAKYFSLVRPKWDAPAPTITAVAGNIGAASITHPSEPRKFSIAELKRLCSFPDDFQLKGTYQEQAERLGRSVPPLMMFEIASVIREEILNGKRHSDS